MGQLLGIASRDVIALDRFLFSVPDTLSSPSLDAVRAQADGWGAAAFDRGKNAWQLERRALQAGAGVNEASAPPAMRGTVLVAHVLSREAFQTSREAMLPIRRGSWVFASDGRIEDRDAIRRTISPARIAECRSDTDAELVFAHLLTRLDEAGANSNLTGTDRAVLQSAAEEVELPTFVLSNGVALYAHRGPRSLHLLERHDDAQLVAVATEPLTDEVWLPLGQRVLLRCAPRPALDVAILRGSDPRAPLSDRELPFTD
jgi:predicted glutamine amidotransferase